MKKFIISLIVFCLNSALISLSVKASDYLNHSQIDEILTRNGVIPRVFLGQQDQENQELLMPEEVVTELKKIKKSDPVMLLEAALEKALADRTDKELTDFLQGHVVSARRLNIATSQLPLNEAELDFAQSEDPFQRYLDASSINGDIQKTLWYWYYIDAGILFLKLENFTEAEKIHLKASRIHPSLFRENIISYVQGELQEYDDDRQTQPQHSMSVQEKQNYWSKLAIYFEKLRGSQQEIPFDCNDYILLSQLFATSQTVEKMIEYGSKALECPWPKPTDRHFGINADRNGLKIMLAHGYYISGKSDMVNQLLITVPVDKYDAQTYVFLALMEAKLQKWEHAFEYFKNCTQLSSKRGVSFSLTNEEAVLLIQMLMSQSSRDIITYGFHFIKIIKHYFPSVTNDVNTLWEHLKAKREAEARRLVQRAVVRQAVSQIKEAYQNYEEVYQGLWAHSSLLLPEQRIELLDSLNESAHQVETNYRKFIAFTDEEIFANVSAYKQFGRLLEEKLATFFSQVKESQHEISKIRRQLYRQAQTTKMKDEENFIEFMSPPSSETRSIKAQILSSQREEEAKGKDKVKSKQPLSDVMPQERTESSEQSIPDISIKTHQEGIEQEGIEEDLSSSSFKESMIRSFKDRRLAHIWKTKDLNGASENILEMLSALHQARSIFHLRSLLRVGTALEILKGDRSGQISLRINSQYRLCFYWIPTEGAYGLEMVDYH